MLNTILASNQITMIPNQVDQIKTTSSSMSAQNQKVTKVRRTRQPRNPQLSVARRNERERNRVKMVNNGFAMLREHLPIEYLQATGCDQSGSDTPDPAGSKSSGKTKKFSKVETLRAAIQHIRMLEELMRSSEPAFESMNIVNQDNQHMYGVDEEPLSIGEPLSNLSSSCETTNSTQMTSNSTSNPHMLRNAIYDNNNQSEQFVKLEPQPIHTIASSPRNELPCSPAQTLATTTCSGLNNQQYDQKTQVHNNNNNHHQAQLEQSHTHLWIQQHQSSFMEQQQLYLQQQNWYNTSAEPSSQPDQQQQNWQQYQQYQASSPQQHQHQQQQQQQQQQVWFANSPSGSNSTNTFQPSPPVPSASVSASATNSNVISQSQPTFSHHQQHQISLYSQ